MSRNPREFGRAEPITRSPKLAAKCSMVTPMTTGPKSLGEVFTRSAQAHPERPALVVDGETWSYAALASLVRQISVCLQSGRDESATPHTVVLGQRTLAGFAGILAALDSGHAYVPIIPSFPHARAREMLVRSEARAVVVDTAGLARLADFLAEIDDALHIVAPRDTIDAEFRARFPAHRFTDASELPGASDAATRWCDPWAHDDPADAAAYLLFTSGSTGHPKGVVVAHRNILRFLDVVRERYALGPEDRFSHLFDVTFDLSLFDMFAAWSVGACLCCPDARQRLLPAQYARDEKLSVWFSVPSTAALMKKTRTLGENTLPDLRWVLFCGEALPLEVAKAFALAAPNAEVENLYGPTELTLACTVHRLRYDDDVTEDGDDLVPIGEPFPEMRARVVNAESLEEVAPGELGELALSGPQCTPGYWRDPERTAKAFVLDHESGEIFYRTGDRVRRPDDGGPLRYLGRVDHQVKIRGYRVELGEVESVIRREAGVDTAIAMGWPENPAGYDGLVAFLDDAQLDTKALKAQLSAVLPKYMVPRQFHFVEEFPVNANGKVDRKALRARLEAGER